MALISDIVPVEFDFGAIKTLPAADHSTPSNLRPPTAPTTPSSSRTAGNSHQISLLP